MKRFHLAEEERHTLFEMGMWHPQVRRRTQALARLAHCLAMHYSKKWKP